MLAPATSCRLLDSYPLIRSRSAEEARQRVGDVFSPHRLALRGDTRGLNVRHNRVALGQSAINVLHYGAEVEIDIPSTATCEPCGGSGAKPGTKPAKCSTCQGAGRVTRERGHGLDGCGPAYKSPPIAASCGST